ncbi:cyclin family protein [Sporobolomyces koalae]|uniref:cyclin family protein n=1 Tax=Sporobolomyces koalae TaxID=500713 RepID=UPI00317589D0
MSAPTPPHSSPESADEAASASQTRSHSHSRPYHLSCSPRDRPEAKRPRSSLSHNQNPPCSYPIAQHDSERHLPVQAPATPHYPSPALTPEELLPAVLEPSFPPTSSLEAEGSTSTEASQRITASPALLQAEKDRFVNGLVGASVLAIESIWGPSSPAPSSSASNATQFSTASSVLPLHYFVREVLRRSRTSCSTLQLALYYLHKSRKPIRDAVAIAHESRAAIKKLAVHESERDASKQEAAAIERYMSPDLLKQDDAATSAYPSPPESPDTPHLVAATDASSLQMGEADEESLSDRFSRLLEAQKSPLLCGRRMFLASLISASKYLQDRNYSNRAWAKISGLEIKEINTNERAFLALVGWELHLKADDFKRWTNRLNTLTAAPVVPTVAPAPEGVSRQSLARSTSEYLPIASASLAAASDSSARPVSSNLVRSRLALARGASAPLFEASSKIPTSRSTGFPIAQPIARTAVPRATRSKAAPASAVDAQATEVPSRQVKALPNRRTRFAATPAAAGVPISWGLTVGFDSRGSELVQAH